MQQKAAPSYFGNQPTQHDDFFDGGGSSHSPSPVLANKPMQY